MTERTKRRSAAGAVAVMMSVLTINTAGAQSAPDTLPWATRSRSFRASGCAKPDWPACSSVEIAWPEFTTRAAARAHVNRLLLPSLVIAEQPVPRRASVAQVANEFLRAGRSSSADGMHWDAKRTISVLCNTATRVLLQADEYTFTGGAHGNPSTQLLAFDPVAGRIISGPGMVPLPVRPQLLPAVERAFRRERELPPTGSLADSGYTFKNDTFSMDAASLAVCGSSLFVYWNVYDIGPYSVGAPHLVIPLDSVPMLRQ
jgi:hypothetical protein